MTHHNRVKQFENDLRIGHLGERLAMAYLESKGFSVTLHKQGRARSRAEAFGYKGSVDLYADGIPIEIKYYSGYFKTPRDYPYQNVILDSVRKWDAKRIAPDVVIIVAQGDGGMVGLDCESKNQWREINYVGRNKSFSEPYYMAPKSLLLSAEEIVTVIRELSSLLDVWSSRSNKPVLPPREQAYRVMNEVEL